MSAQRGRGRGDVPGARLEGLEPRIVLSSVHDLASIGIFSDEDGLSPFAAELQWGDDREVSGTQFIPGEDGPDDSPFSPIYWINGPEGMLRTIDEASAGIVTNGARFLDSEDYPLGWSTARNEDDSAAAFRAIIERPAAATGADLAGSYVWNFTQFIGGEAITRHGLIEINGTTGLFGPAFGAFGDPVFLGEGFEITAVGPKGRFEYGGPGGDTGVMYLSRDFSTILIADLNETGGDSMVGIAIRQDFDVTPAELAGTYRLGAVADGVYSEDLFGGRTTDRLLELDADGSYSIFELANADTGEPGDAVSTGEWTSESGLINLVDGTTGVELQFKFGANGSTLLFMQVRDVAEGAAERPLGLATRVVADPDAEFDTTVASAVFDADGNPLVFDLGLASDTWSVVDLNRYGFGAPLGDNPADIEPFTASDDTLFAVVTTDDGLFAFERGEDGFWRGANLTDDLEGAENIVSPVTVFTDLRGSTHVAGVTDAGDMVTYVFDPDQTTQGGWSFLNISESQLDPKGQATPVFVGPIISYVTSWNGLNIAGLDADGNIRAVWSGNGGTVWNASNLSTITGAPAMASGLTAYLTSWGGINIVGLDEGGRVLATWWVPSFGGDWRTSDLTAAANGPRLTGDSLTSFVAPWGGLNVAGLNASGDVIAYWWSPATERDGLGWEVANLTGAIPNSEPRPTEQLHSQTNTSHRGEMNVMGTDEDSGDLLRLFFRVDEGSWDVQNVSADAEFI